MLPRVAHTKLVPYSTTSPLRPLYFGPILKAESRIGRRGHGTASRDTDEDLALRLSCLDYQTLTEDRNEISLRTSGTIRLSIHISPMRIAKSVSLSITCTVL